MSVIHGLALLAAASAAPATPTPASPATTPPAAVSVQALFDRAAAAFDADRLEQALADYDALERRVARSPRSLAIVRVRRGEVLLRLGREEEAATALRRGLANLPADDRSLADDRYLAFFNLGATAEEAFDYPAAQTAYSAAAAIASTPAAKRAAEVGIVRVTMFDDASAAVALAGRIVDEVAADPSITPERRAQYRTIKGRALLNAGSFAAARAELRKAMAELGGLTTRVNIPDIAARSDLAIAALLDKDTEEARKLIAYTGAGLLKEGLESGSVMEPPPCGGPDDLRPDDVAVVEFSIADDGAVRHAKPIYVSRQGPAARAFGRAAAEWAWTAEQAKAIKPFFRILTRVEVRCSTVSVRPDIGWLLVEASRPWLEAHGVRSIQSAGASRIDQTRATLRQREATEGLASLTLLPLLATLAGDPRAMPEEAAAAAARASAIAEAGGAPPALVAFLLVNEAAARTALARPADRRLLQALAPIRARPAIAADPIARAGVAIYEADLLARLKRRGEGLTLLQAVASDERLPRTEPFKVGALVRIAAIEAERDNLAAARAAYDRTGLSAQQCALVDASPSIQRTHIGSGTFPVEALRWGFEGWVRTEFDITADGRTANVRAITAYPPFVFSPATVNGVKGMRYTQSYRPEGGLGCGGQRQALRFQLP